MPYVHNIVERGQRNRCNHLPIDATTREADGKVGGHVGRGLTIVALCHCTIVTLSEILLVTSVMGEELLLSLAP